MTPEEIDEDLRALGYDPDEVGKRMKMIAEREIERHNSLKEEERGG